MAEGAQDVHGKPGRTGFRGLGLYDRFPRAGSLGQVSVGWVSRTGFRGLGL